MEHRGQLVNRELVLLIHQLRDSEELDVLQSLHLLFVKGRHIAVLQGGEVTLHHFAVDEQKAVLQILLQCQEIHLLRCVRIYGGDTPRRLCRERRICTLLIHGCICRMQLFVTLIMLVLQMQITCLF